VSISASKLTRPASTPAKMARVTTHAGGQLLDRVDALVHKVGIPAPVTDKVSQVKESAQSKVDVAERNLHKGIASLQDKAGEATLQGKTLASQALAKVPPPVGGRIEQLMGTVRRRPMLAAALILALFLVLRLRRLLH
jgi:hypothetical protein